MHHQQHFLSLSGHVSRSAQALSPALLSCCEELTLAVLGCRQMCTLKVPTGRGSPSHLCIVCRVEAAKQPIYFPEHKGMVAGFQHAIQHLAHDLPAKLWAAACLAGLSQEDKHGSCQPRVHSILHTVLQGLEASAAALCCPMSSNSAHFVLLFIVLHDDMQHGDAA